ncbi:MAG: hypothetical protein GC191_03210 [Azospirillum sp.]|nr:hypothetical protein [Azospirillum sp.]
MVSGGRFGSTRHDGTRRSRSTAVTAILVIVALLSAMARNATLPCWVPPPVVAAENAPERAAGIAFGEDGDAATPQLPFKSDSQVSVAAPEPLPPRLGRPIQVETVRILPPPPLPSATTPPTVAAAPHCTARHGESVCDPAALIYPVAAGWHSGRSPTGPPRLQISPRPA